MSPLAFLPLLLSFILPLVLPSHGAAGQPSASQYTLFSAFAPLGVALDSSGDMYVAEQVCFCVIKLSPDGRELRRFNVSSGRYSFFNPPYVQDVALDGAGNIYVAGGATPQAQLIKLSPSGALLAQFNSGQRSLPQLSAIALDSASNVYSADRGSRSVYKFAPTGPLLMTFKEPLLSPVGVAVDEQGFVYVLDASQGSSGWPQANLYKFAANGSVVMAVAGPARWTPLALALDPDRNILVLLSPGRFVQAQCLLVTYSPDGLQLHNFTVAQRLPPTPHLRLDSAGDLYLTAERAVVKLSSSDGRQLAAYNNSAPPFHNPGGLAVDPAGNIYVADSSLDYPSYAVKLSPSGRVLQTFAGNSSLGYSPGSPLALDRHGNVFVVDLALQAVVKLSPSGAVLALFTTASPPLQQPLGLAVDAEGSVWVADYFHDRVVKIAANNSLLAVITAPYPADVALDADGNVYIVDSSLARVEKFSPDGRSLFNFTASPRLYQPLAVALDAAGNVFIADFQNHRIVKIDPAGQQLAVYATNTSDATVYPQHVAVDLKGNVYTVNGLSVVKFTHAQAGGTQLVRPN